MNSHSTTNSDDRFWQAFQYVAGELSAEESNVFELQMLEDTSLCEAVVQASKLSLHIATTNSGVVKATRPATAVLPPAAGQQSRPLRMVAALTAICGCAAIVSVLSMSLQAPDQIVAMAEPIEAELLVNVWADEFARDTANESEINDSFAGELDVPEWLLAAVSLTDESGAGTTAEF